MLFFYVKVYSDPEVDSLAALKSRTCSLSLLYLAVTRPRLSEEAPGCISHIFYAKVTSDPAAEAFGCISHFCVKANSDPEVDPRARAMSGYVAEAAEAAVGFFALSNGIFRNPSSWTSSAGLSARFSEPSMAKSSFAIEGSRAHLTRTLLT